MKIAMFAYRPWALKIYNNILAKTHHQVSDLDNCDVALYFGWSWMIPKEIYEKKLCLILHTSPVPKYRGGSPLQHQIINGERMSAASILEVAEKVDTGKVYSQTPFSLEGSIQDIFDRLTKIGTRDVIKVLAGIEDGTLKPIVQDESKATTYRRRRAEESELTMEDLKTKTAKELYNFIRALGDPYPNAYIKCRDGKKVFLTGARLEQD